MDSDDIDLNRKFIDGGQFEEPTDDPHHFTVIKQKGDIVHVREK